MLTVLFCFKWTIRSGFCSLNRIYKCAYLVILCCVCVCVHIYVSTFCLFIPQIHCLFISVLGWKSESFGFYDIFSWRGCSGNTEFWPKLHWILVVQRMQESIRDELYEQWINDRSMMMLIEFPKYLHARKWFIFQWWINVVQA